MYDLDIYDFLFRTSIGLRTTVLLTSNIKLQVFVTFQPTNLSQITNLLRSDIEWPSVMTFFNKQTGFFHYFFTNFVITFYLETRLIPLHNSS